MFSSAARRFRTLSLNLLPATFVLLLPLAFSQSGNLRTMGLNTVGQVGYEDPFVEQEAPFATNVSAAAAGDGCVFYFDGQGHLWAAGDNRFGQLGINSFEQTVMEPIDLGTRFSKVIPNGRCTFFLTEEGELFMTGATPRGFVAPFSGTYLRPVFIMSGIRDVAPSGSSILYLHEDGNLSITANRYAGLFGFPNYYYLTSPLEEPIPVDENVVDGLIVGTNIIALHEDGTLTTLGPSYREGPHDPESPLLVDSSVTAISPWGSNGFTYLRSDGAAFLWFRHQVVEIAASGVLSIEASRFSKEDNTHWVFNYPASVEANQTEEMGIWETVVLERLDEWASVSVGTGVIATLRGNGDLMLSGESQLVAGMLPWLSSDSPHLLVPDASQVRVSQYNTFFKKADGTLWGFGSNFGVLNDEMIERSQDSPAFIADGVVDFSAFYDALYFTDVNGDLWRRGRSGHWLTLIDGEATSSLRKVSSEVIAFSGTTHSVSFITEDRKLWLLGSNAPISDWETPQETFEEPYLVAENALAVQNGGDRILWVDTNGSFQALGYLGSHFGEQIGEPYHLADNVTDIYIVDGTNLIVYITADDQLYSLGSGYFNPDDVTVPVLIDEDVAQVRVSRANDIYYEKQDGTLWYRGARVPFGSPVDLAPGPAQSTQVFTGETVIDFDIARYHLAIITDTSDEPRILSGPADQTIELGESATLSVEMDDTSFSGYIWYKGESGDRSEPLYRTGLPSYSVTPYESGSYWVEAYNPSGVAQSEAAIVTVSNALSGNYLDWAKWWNLPASAALPTQNMDTDSYSNFEEFVLGLDPMRSSSETLTIGFDPEQGDFYLSLYPNPYALEFLAFYESEDLVNWTEFTAASLDLDSSYVEQIPMNLNGLIEDSPLFLTYELKVPETE